MLLSLSQPSQELWYLRQRLDLRFLFKHFACGFWLSAFKNPQNTATAADSRLHFLHPMQGSEFMHCLPSFCSQPGKWWHKNPSAMQERLLQPLLSAGGTIAAGSYRRGLGVWGEQLLFPLLAHAPAPCSMPQLLLCCQDRLDVPKVFLSLRPLQPCCSQGTALPSTSCYWDSSAPNTGKSQIPVTQH